jgi:hypothetical protein
LPEASFSSRAFTSLRTASRLAAAVSMPFWIPSCNSVLLKRSPNGDSSSLSKAGTANFLYSGEVAPTTSVNVAL